MNRSELASLLAANPPVSPSSSSPIMFQGRVQHPIASSPISPRGIFQSRVRNLHQEPSLGEDASPHHRRHSELEHVSTLRATHKRSHSAQPASQDTPDFRADEWEAWGQKSPKLLQPRRNSAESNVISLSRPQQEPGVPPLSSQPHPKLQPRPQVRNFKPLCTITDVDERPKTSRGPPLLEVSEERVEKSKEGELKEDEVRGEEDETPKDSPSTHQTSRTSKFIEGSMNERSFGIASSWLQRASIESGKPLPPTPATKHVTFSCTPAHESLEEHANELLTTKRKERRSLRRSISNFNFHGLSEKMKFFGGPSNDAASEAQGKMEAPKPEIGINILNERKRKADEEYAVQFGFKKQKFGTQPNPPAPSPNVGGNKRHSRTVDQNSHISRSSRRFGTAALANHGLPRKKSRRELESENAELRARLTQQGHQTPARSQNFIRGKAVMLSPGKKRGRLGEDVPPVPQIPGRGILKVLEDSKRNSMAPIMEQKGETSNGDGKKHAHIARQHFDWPDDVF